MSELESPNDEYVRRYNEIKGILAQAYYDRFLLVIVKNYSNIYNDGKYAIPNSSHNVLGYLNELIKADMALQLCKITDHSDKANTLNNLKIYLENKHSKQSDASLSPDLFTWKKDHLFAVRDQFLAHNDLKKLGTSIDIDTLIRFLEDVNRVLNELCFPEIDERATPFTAENTVRLALSTSGLAHLIDNSLVEVKPEIEEGNDNA